MFNLRAKVLKVDEPIQFFTRLGNQGVVANALIGDETGTVQLSLWGEQIGSVSVGDIIQVLNARILAFKGMKQLRVGKKGALKVEHDSIPA
jgi:replication factor A1